MTFSLLLCVAACECDDGGRPARGGQRDHKPFVSESRAPLPPPEGTPIEASVLAPLLPETLAGATADGEAEARTTPLGNGGKLPAARRNYTLGAQRIALELSDTQHAPGVRQVIERDTPAGATTQTRSWRTTTLRGTPAVVQFDAPKQKAVANLLVSHRLLINVIIEGASGPEDAEKIAEQLPFDAFAKVLAPEPAPATPSATPTPTP